MKEKKCPYCGSNELWRYLYNQPDNVVYDKNYYILGNDEFSFNKPVFKCKKCGKNIDGLTADLDDIKKDFSDIVNGIKKMVEKK